jgi:tmRNA-binding protein
MHILEQYALNCGLKIGKPYIYEKFFPIPFEKYITFNPFGKFNSRKYSYWQEVIDLLIPLLSKHNIHIVQIGGQNEQGYMNCFQLIGKTNFNQTAHIIKNGLLHFGVDSFPIHIASHFDKKIVGLYCNMYSSQSKPYWSDEENVVLLQADLQGKKPSYAAEENPKTINRIKPETIANSIIKLLNLEEKINFETVFIGDKYGHLLLESTPSTIVSPDVLPNILLNIRFDYVETIKEKDYISIFNNLNIRDCAFITDKFIDLKKFYNLKHKIKNIFYDITTTEIDFNFLKELYSLNFKVDFVFNKSKEPNEEILNSKKLQLINHQEVINIIENTNQDFKNLVQLSLFYKSKKLLFADNKIYLSKAGYLENKPITVNDLNVSQKISEISNIDNLKEDLDYILLYK